MKTLPLTEVKMKLSKLVDRVESMDEEILITRNGRIAGVLISPNEFESWKETMEIRKDKALMSEIKKGLKGLKKTKKTYSREDLKHLLS